MEEVSPGVVAAAAAARRARAAGSHADEAALFWELEQAERGFSAGAGAKRSEPASEGLFLLFMSASLQAMHISAGLEGLD